MKKTLLVGSFILAHMIALPAYSAGCPMINADHLKAMGENKIVEAMGLKWEAASSEDAENMKKAAEGESDKLNIETELVAPYRCGYKVTGSHGEVTVRMKIASR